MEPVSITFQVNSEEVARRIQEAVNAILRIDTASGRAAHGLQANVRKMEDSLGGLTGAAKKAGAAMGAYLTLTAFNKLKDSIIAVRGEMQMLESSFDVLLGGKGVKDFTDALKQFSVESPLSLSGVSGAAQTLLAFNIEASKVIPTIRQMGDISMGNEEKFKALTLAFAQMSATGRLMGQDLLQMINAGFSPLAVISEKTGKSIGALKKEMESGAISAEMVTEAFRSATAEGGKFYGMTAKQAEGIKGLQAQLEGGIQEVLNNIGKSQEELIVTGYKAAVTLVENYETVGKVLLGLIATYGAYRTAIALTVAAEKGWTIAWLAGYRALLLLEKAQKLLNATMLSNPYVLATVAAVALVAAVWALHDGTSAEEKAQARLNERLEDTAAKKSALTSRISSLLGVLRDETQSVYAQTKAWRELKEAMPEVFASMTPRTVKALPEAELTLRINTAIDNRELNDLNNAYDEAIKKVEEFKALVAATPDVNDGMGGGALKKGYVEQLEAALLDARNLKSELDKINNLRLEAEFDTKPAEEKLRLLNAELETLKKEQAALDAILLKSDNIRGKWGEIDWATAMNLSRLEGVKSSIQEILGKITGLALTPAVENKSHWETVKKNAEAALGAMSAAQEGTAEWNAQLGLLNQANKMLATWDFSAKKQEEGNKDYEAKLKAEKAYSDANLGLQKSLSAQKVELMREGVEKEKAIIDRQYRDELEAINNLRDKVIEAYNDRNGLKGAARITSSDYQERIPGLSDDVADAQVAALANKVNKQVALEKSAAEKINAIREDIASRSNTELENELVSLKNFYKEKKKEAQEAGADELLLKEIDDAWLRGQAELKNKFRSEAVMRQIDFDQELATIELDARKRDLKSESEYNLEKIRIQKEANERRIASLTSMLSKASQKQKKSIKEEIALLQAMNKVLDSDSEGEKTKQLKDNISLAVDGFSELASLVGVFDDELGKALSTMGEMFDKMTRLVDSIKSMQSGATGIVSIFMQAAQFVLNDTKQSQAEKAARKKEVEAGYWEAVNRKIERQIELVKELGAEVAAQSNAVVEGHVDELREIITTYDIRIRPETLGPFAESVKKVADSGSEVGKKFLRNFGEGISSDFNKNGFLVKDLFKGFTVDEILEIRYIEGIWSYLPTAVQDYINKLAVAKARQDELKDTINESLTGTTAKQIADIIISGLREGKKGIPDFVDAFEDMMKEAMLKSLEIQLNKDVEDFYGQYAELAKDGLTKEEIESLQKMWEEIVARSEKTFQDMQSVAGMDFASTADSNDNSLKGAYAKASQESIGLLAGQTGAAVISLRELTEFSRRHTEQARLIGERMLEFRDVGVRQAEDVRAIREIAGEILSGVKDSRDDMREMRDTVKSVAGSSAGIAATLADVKSGNKIRTQIETT